MNDMNSRYRNIDEPGDVIRTNVDYGYDDMDIMEAENAQKKKQVARASAARGGAAARSRKATRQIVIYGIIIAIEVIALVVIWAMYISYNSKLSKGGNSSAATSAESSDGASSGNINVENDNFSLTCTKMSISTDAMGSPVAIVYFTFVNKTDSPLSMAQVYSPSFMQSGMQLSTSANLAEPPIEITNKDSAVSNGESITCAYAVTLQDTTSEITITMHDNYETFSDIGSTVVPIS